MQAVSHQKELDKLKAEIRELHTHLWIMPVNIMLDGFASKKAEGKSWSSHPFYTHFRGYKLSLSVCCNGKDDKGTHISVFAFLESGEYDDELEWPFQCSITIRLLDQKEGKDHYDRVLSFDEAPDDCRNKNSGWGIPRFWSQEELSPRYLVNDSLCFNVS